MKTKFYTIIVVMLLCADSVKSIAQNANTSLSNLTSITKVNVSLLPDKNNKHDLGSAGKSWKNIYFTGSQFSGTNRVGTLLLVLMPALQPSPGQQTLPMEGMRSSSIHRVLEYRTWECRTERK